MKRTYRMLSGAVALLCLVSFFMPVIAPRYPASQYHPGSDSYTKDYFLVGEYYVAREYWSLAKFALSSGYKLVLSVACALLLYWATMSLMGEDAHLAGVVASMVNLGVVAYLLARLLGLRAGVRWPILIVLIVDVVAGVAVAWLHFLSGRERRYIRGTLLGEKVKGGLPGEKVKGGLPGKK